MPAGRQEPEGARWWLPLPARGTGEGRGGGRGDWADLRVSTGPGDSSLRAPYSSGEVGPEGAEVLFPGGTLHPRTWDGAPQHWPVPVHPHFHVPQGTHCPAPSNPQSPPPSASEGPGKAILGTGWASPAQLTPPRRAQEGAGFQERNCKSPQDQQAEGTPLPPHSSVPQARICQP